MRRAELHLRVGEALERGDGRSGRALADLAHHFAAAAPFGGPGAGVEYNSARRARRPRRWPSTRRRRGYARRSSSRIESPRRARRGVPRARHGQPSGRQGARRPARRSALRRRSPASWATRELLARAAIGYEDACWRPGIADQGAVELLEEAAAALGEESSELRVGLLSGLARALDFQGDHERGAMVRTSAVAMARRLRGSRRPRHGAGALLLVAGHELARGDPRDADRGAELGEELGNTEIRAEAMAWRVPAFVALGDLESARREVAVLLRDRRADGPAVHAARGRALRLGDRARRRAPRRGRGEGRRSHEWSRLLTGRDASGVYGIQMFSIRREQGRLAELAPVIRILAGEAEREGPWRPGLVSVLVELGMEDGGAAGARAGRRRGAGRASASRSGWPSLTYLTDASAALGDEAIAALVYPELEPLAGTNVMIGHLVACYGAADRYLGMLATTLGEWERAEEHFERAMELNRRMGAATWLAHTAYEYARMLLARGAASATAAAALLGEAAGLAERIGMPALLGRVRALGVTAPPPALPDGLSAARGQILAPRRARPQQPRDRRGAVHQRAHGRQPHPQHPAQDRLREPHRGRLLRTPARPRRGVSPR